MEKLTKKRAEYLFNKYLLKEKEDYVGENGLKWVNYIIRLYEKKALTTKQMWGLWGYFPKSCKP
jgi:hypothetical protein